MKNKQEISAPDQISFDSTKELNKIRRNDKAFTLKMLRLFIAAAKKCNKKMRSCIKENNWAELKALAHKHIPTYCVMGLNELANSLKYIDQHALEKEKHKTIEDRIRSLYRKNSEAIDAVKRYIGLIRFENNAPVITQEEHYTYVT